MIDITMTASAARPEILDKTLNSIERFIINNDWYKFRLIINIDCRGEEYFKKFQCRDVLNKSSITDYTEYTNSNPISASQKRVWEQTFSEFVLNWEDDWEALRKIDLNRLVELMKSHPKAAMIYLDREDKSLLNHNGYGHINKYMGNNLFKRENGLLLWSSPALVRREYIKQAIPFIKENEYMDFTSRTEEVQKFLKRWDFLYYMGEDGRGNFVRDLGRPWMKENGLIGNKQGPKGYQWEKINV